jgi:isoleucyl-tRNA synthetase
MQGFDPDKDLVKNEEMILLDRWIVSKTFDLQQKYYFRI